MPPHASVAFCNSDCTFSSVTLLSLSRSHYCRQYPRGMYINASYARNNKCLRFRLTLLFLSLSPHMPPESLSLFRRVNVKVVHSITASAKIARALLHIMHIFFLKLAIIAMPRDSENILRLRRWTSQAAEKANVIIKCIIKFILQYSQLFLREYVLRFRKREDKTEWSRKILIR